MKIVVIARQEAILRLRSVTRGKSKEVFSDFTFLYAVWDGLPLPLTYL
ncbi:MAG: hypothetical protein HEQ13_05690 [Dolichospermum sp. DEX189]|nr:hypothetical protein [Dolichospermum sp. DEX189]